MPQEKGRKGVRISEPFVTSCLAGRGPPLSEAAIHGVLPFSLSLVAFWTGGYPATDTQSLPIEQDLSVLPKRIALAAERAGDQAGRLEQPFEIAARVP